MQRCGEGILVVAVVALGDIRRGRRGSCQDKRHGRQWRALEKKRKDGMEAAGRRRGQKSKKAIGGVWQQLELAAACRSRGCTQKRELLPRGEMEKYTTHNREREKSISRKTSIACPRRLTGPCWPVGLLAPLCSRLCLRAHGQSELFVRPSGAAPFRRAPVCPLRGHAPAVQARLSLDRPRSAPHPRRRVCVCSDASIPGPQLPLGLLRIRVVAAAVSNTSPRVTARAEPYPRRSLVVAVARVGGDTTHIAAIACIRQARTLIAACLYRSSHRCQCQRHRPLARSLHDAQCTLTVNLLHRVHSTLLCQFGLRRRLATGI